MATQDFLGDLDEDAGGRGEHGAACVAQLGGAAMFPASGALDVGFGPPFKDKVCCERNGTEVVDGDVARHGDDAMVAIGLAHGFIEQCGDDAAVGVARGSLELLAEVEAAEDAVVIIDKEFQTKPSMIVRATPEAALERAMRQRDFA